MPTPRIPAGLVKYVIGWGIVFAVRLVPGRAPNVEPVLTTLMPFSKRYGAAGAFLFGFASIALFDIAVRQVGPWTWVTAVAYGLVGIGSAFFFRNREVRPISAAAFAIIGTIAYDAATGLSIGPLFFDQPLAEAFFGQIPFTLLHLAGNVALGAVASPLIARWLVENEGLELPALRERLRATAVESR